MKNIASTATKRETLARKAYNVLENLILTLKLKPGSVITERALMETTGLSRTPLREAILRLSRERLLNVLPHKGVMINEVNIMEFLTILETRRALDALIAEKAAGRATEEERNALQRIGMEMKRASGKKHLSEFLALDRAFDEVVAQACRNPFAVRAVKPAHAHCRRFWFMHKQHGDLRRAASLHSSLIDAIVAGNARASADASNRLIDYLLAFTKKTIHL